MSINLKFIKASPGQTFYEIKKGLIWSLSFLGAKMPPGSGDKMIVRQIGQSIFEINFNKVGFPESAKAPLAKLLDSLKNTEEYQRMCAISIGRFVVLSVHSPAHYYAITGAEKRLENFKNWHGLNEHDALCFPVLHSGVADGTRVLRLKKEENPKDFAFLAEEGRGDWALGNFRAEEFETIAVMPNGQLRFAVYDKNGNLKSATSSVFGGAGKPGNCMWCHESRLHALFLPTPQAANGLSRQEFQNLILGMQDRLFAFQKSLKSEVVFENEDDHAAHELVYTSFMEPSVEAIAQEWELPVQKVKMRLIGLKTHQNLEYQNLYPVLFERKEVDKLAPFQVTPVPESVRQPCDFEPDFFQ